MRIAYICDGGGTLGWGHVWRGRAVVEQAPAGSALVMAHGRDEVAAWFQRHGDQLDVLPWDSAVSPLDPGAHPFDVVIVDHYALSPAWVAASAEARPTFVVDDWMRTRVRATGLVNPNVGAVAGDYPESQVTHWLLGSAFALVRSEVRRLPRGLPEPGVACRVLVTLGGSDPDGRTAEVVEDLTVLPWYRNGGQLTVVLGASYSGAEPWSAWPAARVSALEVVRQPPDFVRRCHQADLVICGASTVSNEMAYLGRPFVPVAFVDNQALVAARWAAEGIGANVNTSAADWRSRLRVEVERLLASSSARRGAAERGMRLVDGLGISRLLDVCAAAAA